MSVFHAYRWHYTVSDDIHCCHFEEHLFNIYSAVVHEITGNMSQ